MKTYNAKPGEIARDWYLVDAEGKTLGRLATQIADRLRGKSKPVFTPHVDTGDFVVVINAEKIAVTGKKLEQKMYYKHSGYPGGLRERTLQEQLDHSPFQRPLYLDSTETEHRLQGELYGVLDDSFASARNSLKLASQRRKTRRPSHRAAGEVRAGDQPEDR